MRRNVMLFCAMGLVALLIMSGSWSNIQAQGGPTPTPNNPVAACGRTLANFVAVLQMKHEFKPQARPSSPNFCKDLEAEANTYVEKAILKPAGEGISGQSGSAFAFIDYAARQYVGDMPEGTPFRAVARNALPGSQMIFCIGESFAVFVDYTFTSLTTDQFEQLPDYRDYTGSMAAFCNASWCRNPRPRPTTAP